MANKSDKETQDHQIFYENFMKFTTYSAIVIIIIVALLAIFLV
ncbi:aa3-type cytochrome c oxidase subunit IV [Alphaproteobacteria bacterium]|nr:aa3-type cytochrome c oxidase subunit IV [Alphaproteobacteria bacterium]